MSKRVKKTAVPRRIIRIGDTYRDIHRNALVTVEDHEIVGGRRTGRVIVVGADVGERFPRRWICPEGDLADVLAQGSPPAPGARP